MEATVDPNPLLTSITPPVITAGRILCLLAALYTVNAHLYLGQGIAWVTMIQDRAPKLGLTEAVADILSGAHPCDRCLAVAAEHEKQKEEAPIPESRPTAKFAPILLTTQVKQLFVSPIGSATAIEPGTLHSQIIDEIPSPPPRKA